MFRPSDWYQITLIFLGLLTAVFFGVFLWREISPEYRIYQDDYVALEEFRSSYTHEPPPDFKKGVKQLLLEKGTQAPVVDRCISCHVALQFPHFSPTKIARDINGNVILDEQGNPVQVPNEDYIWAKLDQRIVELKESENEEGLKEAKKLESLSKVRVDGKIYDVRKALVMHPLIGKETRPFEFHPPSDFGCVSCHSGNGRGLTTEKAHGPVFDGQYEIEFEGYEPKFTEEDPENDPAFSNIFNHKPGYSILFQTTPLYPGSLIQAKCMECHKSSADVVEEALKNTETASQQSQKRVNAIKKAYENEFSHLLELLSMKLDVEQHGLKNTVKDLQKKSEDFTIIPLEQEQAINQFKWLSTISQNKSDEEVLNTISDEINNILGSQQIQNEAFAALKKAQENKESFGYILENFIKEKLPSNKGQGTIFVKAAAWDLESHLAQHIKNTETSFKSTVEDQNFVNSAMNDIDVLTSQYQKGRHLFISQGCYACHRISGFTRGGIGPELTRIGENYPWYVKQSIVWPQADVKSSTMPNQSLDHEELERLVTYLLGQTGKKKSESEVGYRIAIQEWESGRKSPWEKPITPSQMVDLRFNMTVFATEGCAACHRLKGYESNVGYAVEKEKPDFSTIYSEREWFQNLIPENIIGSELVKQIDAYSEDIDKRVIDDVRKNSILEEIEQKFPGDIVALYTPFKYASRAKNHHYQSLIDAETDPKKIAHLETELTDWKNRVRRVLMMFIQEYGLGRLICPKPNWSGIFRSDQWLMEHFKNPSAHVPQSIMPVFPFDDTKFYGLTRMLDELAVKNRNEIREVWKNNGFNPRDAYELLCSQCHGESLAGNGPIAQWIYPIPKNLLNPTFLKNLTKERAIQSIDHGIAGTPMPPWGEVSADKSDIGNTPILTKEEISLLVDWIFSSIPGSQINKTRNVPKWNYSPSDVIQELKQEGNELPSKHSSLYINSEYFLAAINPIAINPENDVSKIFDVVSNPNDGPDAQLYFIKKKFYTSENLEEGRRFFNLNCAVCHGKEADGTGLRGEIMTDAKPRMLINIDWLNSRDDLRILRSIKYGVPGTSMTPWGDLTTSLQRLQLAMFIRSLSQDQREQERLSHALFETFDATQFVVEAARVENYKKIAQLEKELQQLKEQRQKSYYEIQKGSGDPSTSLKNYQTELEILEKLKDLQKKDDEYIKLKNNLKHEQEQYQKIALGLITKDLGNDVMENFFKILELNKNQFTLQDSTLSSTYSEEKKQEELMLIQSILDSIQRKIEILTSEKTLEEGKIGSAERSKKISELDPEIKTLQKLHNDIISLHSEAMRTKEQINEDRGS